MIADRDLISVPAPTGLETALDQRKYFIYGLAATALGILTAVAGFMFAHFTGLPETDNVGREIYASIPRGWALVLAGQAVSVGGAMLAMAGLAVAFLLGRELTWARASLGALLFTALMIMLFGIIPNQWLNLTQGPLEWSSTKTLLTVPKWLVLNNEISISYAVAKDAVLQGYIFTVTGLVIVSMYQWQERAKRRAAGPPPQPVSAYGRPVSKIGRG